MRRVRRPALAPRAVSYLSSKAAQLSARDDIEKVWASARRTRTIGVTVFPALLRMAGVRERCMYCTDSHGTDIDHFWPKARYPQKMFVWDNMLLACTGCNRKKGDRFPVDITGNPLLIDPCIDEPWEHLVFVAETGELAPKWKSQVAGYDARGEAMTNPDILPLNIEAVTSGRQRAHRDLSRIAQRVLGELRAQTGSIADATSAELLQYLAEHDDFGLTRWIFHFWDPVEDPFLAIRDEYSQLWDELREITA